MLVRPRISTAHFPTRRFKPPLVGGHFVVAVPADLDIRNATKITLTEDVSVDLRSAEKGQIVVEPSIHESGAPYTWKRPLPPDFSVLPECPPGLLDRILKEIGASSGGSDTRSAEPRVICEGERSDTLFRLGCAMRRRDASFETIARALLEENVQCCRPPLTEGDVRKIARSAMRYDAAPAAGQSHFPPYAIRNGRFVFEKSTKDGPVDVPLCNFTARITRETVRDDGVEQEITLEIEGQLDTGAPLPPRTVAATQFQSLGWVMGCWGTRAVVSAGPSARDRLREAIQKSSSDAPRSVTYTHTGWRKIGRVWVYLSASGGLGPSGPVDDIEVDLPDALVAFKLPKPPVGAERITAVRASLALLEVGPARITVALHAAIVRAMIGGANFSEHLAGPTGVLKTAVAAVAQAHCGPEFDERHLPGSWSSTANATEGSSFTAKDMPLVVDDFAPRGSTFDQARYHRDADRVFRAVGNHSGRRRMRADGTLRPVKPPRALIISTGEDVPTGESVLARMLVLEVGPGDVKADRLSALQRAAHEGLLAEATSAFVVWLAARFKEIRARFDQSVLEWRDKSFRHRRTSDILGQLAAAHTIWREFAVESGALTAAEAAALGDRVQTALLEAGEAQAALQGTEDVVVRLFALLRGALVAGEAYLEDADSTGPPTQPEKTGSVERWGWRTVEGGSGENAWVRDEPQGRRIGWVRGSDLYLHPDATFRVVQGFAAGQGAALPVTQRTMWHRLKERGFLLSAEKNRHTNRPTIQGQQTRCLHLSVNALFPSMTGLSGLPGREDRETTLDSASASDRSPLSQPENDGAGYESGLRQKIEGTGDQASEPDSPRSPLSPAGDGMEEQEVLEF